MAGSAACGLTRATPVPSSGCPKSVDGSGTSQPRGGRIKALPESAYKQATQHLEYVKAAVRARVEHPFRVLKRQFGYQKVHFRGLAKNTAQLQVLFALVNLWLAQRPLLEMTG